MSQYTECIMTEAGWMDGGFSRYVWLYRDRQGPRRQGLYCNTPRCIVTKKGSRLRLLCRDTVGRPGHDTALVRVALAHDMAACALRRGAGGLRHGVTRPAGGAKTLPRPRGLGLACACMLGYVCAHSALGQFLTQYYF